ncbi:hypothetical protein AVEN_166101-1 [Araneus ventricosus]|uniref:G-protein coupled receptors family 1 profile domain-containing protein n=1 Tax=Araneus ventricosus TaxID=182803 RepID=A0A4Y2FQQ3_ARAVE|nr:hypothetical protein AVEN_166101-1 [Araneus ventricosus]
MTAVSILVPLMALMSVRRGPGESLVTRFLQLRHTGPTPRVMVLGVISYDSRSTLVVIPNTLTANLDIRLVFEPFVLTLLITILGAFPNRVTFVLISLLLRYVLYRVPTY